ncbi:hypothetical protein ACFV6G_35700 [Streptomyces lavendulae]|uniref:hypothetical protein n=1 Tax=Streptomyces lavendulae TaxID=1914 RepID=UPI0036AFDC75
MHVQDEIEQAVETGLPGDRAARIRRDATRVEELRPYGFTGPDYEALRDELWAGSEPILKGMLRSGKLARAALQRCAARGMGFWVHPADFEVMRSDAEARDELLIEIQIKALERFRRKALLGGEWNPDHGGARGASCLMSYFIGQCIWEFRRVYVTWARKRMATAHLYVEYVEGVHGIAGPLASSGYLAEPEAVVFSTDFEDILDEQPPLTQAVVRLTVAGFTDTEIADRLRTTHGAVRTRKTRFRGELYQAARNGRIWIPRQLHTGAAKTERQARVR